MAYSPVYPPGQVQLIGENLLKENIAPHITYVGYEGRSFTWLALWLATLGAQNGVAALTISGLMPPFTEQ